MSLGVKLGSFITTSKLAILAGGPGSGRHPGFGTHSYYKWINSNKPVINDRPSGFMWHSLGDAIKMHDAVKSWIESNRLSLYRIDAPAPTHVPVGFTSDMLRNDYTPKKLSDEDLKKGFAYLHSLPEDHLSTDKSTPQDIELLHDIAHTVGPISHAHAEGGVEVYTPTAHVMTKVSSRAKI